MKPQTVLKIDPVGKTAGQIYAVRNEWIKEYKKYMAKNPDCEEIGTLLIDRVTRAAEMLVRRYANVPLEEQYKPDPDSDSDFHWDDYNPEYKEENDSLDGDFPLGDAYDADFATRFFPIEHLVLIQFGASDAVPRGHYVEPAYDVLVRQGFLHELNKEWRDAEACYRGGGMSKSVFRRESECRRRKEAEGEMAYGAAQAYMENGQWGKVYPNLQKAVEMDNTDAMVDMGLSLIYGTFGIPRDYDEGLELIRRAAEWHHNIRACMELVELYDNGAAGIEGSDAERCCKRAAEAGEAEAIARLEDGFDTRPLIEILAEQAEKGNTDAMWWLYNSSLKRQMPEEAQMWYDKALEAGHAEALFEEAKKHLSTNLELAEQYLRRGAEKGHIRSIIGLSELELAEGDKNFWEIAMKKNEPDFAVALEQTERHLRQFAWFKLAAEAGDGDSMNTIATAYHFGYPIERNDEESYRWTMAAADEQNYPAMYQAAYFLENGFGCERDIDRAVEYYTASAEHGIMSSMIRLYEIYKDGFEHIPADQQKASHYLWLSGIGRD